MCVCVCVCVCYCIYCLLAMLGSTKVQKKSLEIGTMAFSRYCLKCPLGLEGA